MYVSRQGEEEEDVVPCPHKWWQQVAQQSMGWGRWRLWVKFMCIVWGKWLMSETLAWWLIIALVISYLAVIMIDVCTRRDFGPLKQTPHLTQRSTLMGPVTQGPCPIRVSDVVVKCCWYVGVVFVLGGRQWWAICSVLGRAMARQPNICKISQSSLYSWTMYINKRNKVLPPYANSPCHKVAHAGNSTSSFSISAILHSCILGYSWFFIC